jgi:hypothetical protein
MLSRPRLCLDENRVPDWNKNSEISPRDNYRKAQLRYSALSPANSAAFCLDAAETIVKNVTLVCSQKESGFYEFDLRPCLDAIDTLAKEGGILSALALSALVHMSKCSDPDLVRGFTSIAKIATKDHYRKATSSECPSEEVITQARNLLSTAPLADSLLLGFNDLNVEDIKNIHIEFVYLKSKNLRGWCAPGTVVLNVFALKHSLCLSHPIPLAIILGHESKHVLERKVVGDMNFSTPDKVDASLPQKNCESGLGFELLAIGEKYNFDFDPDDAPDSEEAQFLDGLVEAIRAGLASKKVPALDLVQLIRFRERQAPRNRETALEYELESSAYYFTE